MLQADRPLGITTLTEETKKDIALKTTGEVPTWLTGTFIRNGPASFSPDGSWFDGLAMLHSFHFDNGKVLYKNRFLNSTPNANVNIAKFADDYVALTETPLPVIFDPKTLENRGLFHYVDILPTTKIWESAHPHTDPETGDIFNFQVQFSPEAKYVIYSMERGSKTRGVIAEIPVKELSYMHSFALTQHYVILTEFPLIKKEAGYEWNGDKKMRILLINKKSGQIAGEYFAEPVFAWHHINSYEQDNGIIIDMAGYKDASTFTSTVDLNDANNEELGRFVRYKIDLELKKVYEKVVGPSIEMPHVNDRYNGKRYTYVYGYDVASPTKRGLVKVDANTRAVLAWSEEGCFADEPVFIQKPGTQGEDEGVVVSTILDTKSKKSFLLILDAKRFKELGRAEVPHHIPFGLHGDYIKDKG